LVFQLPRFPVPLVPGRFDRSRCRVEMLRILPSEIILFARALRGQPCDARQALARQWLRTADLGPPSRAHQVWCDTAHWSGSLASVLMQSPIPPLIYGDDPEFLSSLRIVADAVLTHTAQKGSGRVDSVALGRRDGVSHGRSKAQADACRSGLDARL
jgi:hypothetical protein